MAVALTGATAGEAPLARLAVGALSTHGSVFAPALARGWVAPLVRGALWVAVAGSTAAGSEAVTSWGALVAALTNHVGFAKTLTPHWVTLTAEGALRVTVTGQSSIMDEGGDAADQRGAHLRQSGRRCHQEGVQTHVTNHFLTPLLRLRLVAMETRELRVFGNEDQRVNQDKGSEMSV